MAWYWPFGANEKASDSSQPQIFNRKELNNYLSEKESQLSNREFKELLRRQSEQANVKVDTNQPGFLERLQQKQDDSLSPEEKKAELDKIISQSPLNPPSAENQQPKPYSNYQLDKYRRENDSRESILINCSEIQNSFYKCLAKQSSWDRIASIGRLQTDDCTALADFFVACTDIQKKAFSLFDYEVLETINEMQAARKSIDRVWTTSFENIDQVRDKRIFSEYTKTLRKEREIFHEKYGK